MHFCLLATVIFMQQASQGQTYDMDSKSFFSYIYFKTYSEYFNFCGSAATSPENNLVSPMPPMYKLVSEKKKSIYHGLPEVCPCK